MRLAYSVFLFFHRISLLHFAKERKKGMKAKQEMICFLFAMFLFSSIIEGREGFKEGLFFGTGSHKKPSYAWE